MSLGQLLAEARDPAGLPRFYPRGQHPATAQWREQLAQLEAFPASPERDKALDYIRETLAKFEIGEDRAKRDYIDRYSP